MVPMRMARTSVTEENEQKHITNNYHFGCRTLFNAVSVFLFNGNQGCVGIGLDFLINGKTYSAAHI